MSNEKHPMSRRITTLVLEEDMVKKSLWGFAVVLMAVVAGCTLDNPEAPEPTGPSNFARHIEVRAVPDQLTADGFSSAVIEAVLRGPDGERIAGATIHFDIQGFVDQGNLAPLNGIRPGIGGTEARAVQATTDGSGVARVRYWAPFRTDQPSDAIVTIMAREAGTNFRQVLDRFGRVDIFLRAADRPFPGLPSPEPGCEPPTAEFELSGLCPGGEIESNSTIRVNGAASEGGEAAGGPATVAEFIWDFGDGTVERTGGSIHSHVYSPSLNDSSVTVTLTVVNSCGASAATSEAGLLIVGACP